MNQPPGPAVEQLTNEMAQSADCAKEHRKLAEWLTELLAVRLGVGPWTAIELTSEEHSRLEGELWEQAADELEGEKQAAAEARWEMDREDRLLGRRGGY
jgi:hypothetical protein